MKRMKRIIALALAMVMAFAMNVTVFASSVANPVQAFKITIENENPGHTYQAYQVFGGDLFQNSDDELVLSNLVWGNGITSEGKTELGDAATKAKELDDKTKAKAFAKEVVQYLNEEEAHESEYDSNAKKYIISELSPGYYLVIDRLDSNEKDDFVSDYMVKVVGDTTAKPKGDKPRVDKQVQDEEGDAEENATDGWGETADHAINESFQFKLTATLPKDINFPSYTDGYKVVFTDTMSDGVTFESIASVKIKTHGTPPGTIGLTKEQYVTDVQKDQKGGSWTLTIEDITGIGGIDLTEGAIIEVIYNAHLNEDAQVGNVTDNNNKVGLKYSNNPNAAGTGKTPEDTVWVFTYKMDNTKIDGDTETPLGGAGFRLYDSTGETEIKLIFDINLGAYRPVKSGEDGEEMRSAETTGLFNIVGLDAGTYVLKETTIPPGYNVCDPITVIISAEHKEMNIGGTVSAVTEITMTMQQGSNAQETIVDTANHINGHNEIINNSGAILPETGGIGTTIFYVIGAILMIGAGVMLITRKRMSK